MAFNGSNNDNKMFNEINITPLTDIFLVLLIIMMVVAPMFQSDNNAITLPKISTGNSVEKTGVTVCVTKSGDFYINGNKTSQDNLYIELENLKNSVEKKEIIVKADSETKSSEIMKIMKAATDAEYEKLVVAGEALTQSQQKDLENNEQENKQQHLSNIGSLNNDTSDYRGEYYNE